MELFESVQSIEKSDFLEKVSHSGIKSLRHQFRYGEKYEKYKNLKNLWGYTKIEVRIRGFLIG